MVAENEKMVERIYYRELKKYKYEIVQNYNINVQIFPDKEIIEPDDFAYLTLKPDGELTIHGGYAWDGPSGPTLDTSNSMRGSLVHDALYQLMRQRKLPLSFKEQADRLLQSICIEDGMGTFRAWLWYQAVKGFGGSGLTPQVIQDVILYAPK